MQYPLSDEFSVYLTSSKNKEYISHIIPMDTYGNEKSRLPAAPPYTTILLFPKDDNPAANANGTVKPSTLEMY